MKGLADQTKIDLAKQGWMVLEYVPFGVNVSGYEDRRLKYLTELDLLEEVHYLNFQDNR